MRRLLHFQADRIEMVLTSHKVPARVTGGTITPRLVRYHISTPLGVIRGRASGIDDWGALVVAAGNSGTVQGPPAACLKAREVG